MNSHLIPHNLCLLWRVVPIDYKNKFLTVKCHEMTEKLEDDLKFLCGATEIESIKFSSTEEELNSISEIKIKQMPTVHLHPKSNQCPKCSSEKLKSILYGLPNEEGMKLVEQGKVVLGGCEIDPDFPEVHCSECTYQWSWK